MASVVSRAKVIATARKVLSRSADSTMIRGEPDAVEGIRHAMTRGLPDLIQYLGEQMSAGRLRRMHPIIAFQLLAGPIFVHVATRPLAAMLGFQAPLEDVVRQMVDAWLRAMVPSGRSRE
jgi:hypothetical protein